MAVASPELSGVLPAWTPQARVDRAWRDKFQLAEEGGEVGRRVVVDPADRLGVAAESFVRVLTVGADGGDHHVTARRQGGRVARHEVTRGLRGGEVQQVAHEQAGRLGQVDAASDGGEDLRRLPDVAVDDGDARIALGYQGAE